MRSPRERWVTPLDRALLDSLACYPTVVDASRAMGMSRDRAMYRLRRLAQWTGRPVVRSARGGNLRGLTTLTPWGRALVRADTGTLGRRPSPRVRLVSRENRFRGVWRRDPDPVVEVGDGLRWFVAFRARPGEAVTVGVDPEAVLVAPARFPSSARNVLVGAVSRWVRRPGGTAALDLSIGRHRLRAAVTLRSVRQLGIRPGRRVFLYVKATAVRRTGDSRTRTPSRVR